MQLSFGPTPNVAPGQVSFGGDAGDTDANVQPSTTTIKTNSDGSRDVTHKTSYTADQAPQSGFSFNSSYNNAAPTAPVAPAAPQQGQLGSGTGMGIMPEAAPVAPAALAQTFGQAAQPTTQSIPQVPEPGPGVQVAGPMVAGAAGGAPQPQPQPPAAPAPVAPTQLAPPAAGASAEGNAGEAEAQAAQSTGQANPYAIMQNDPAVADQVRQQHMDILNNNSDIRVAAAKSGDTNLPMDVRHMFAMQTADLSRYNMEQQKAKEKVATMTPSEISRVLQKDHPDGSWTRYLITGILGLTGLNRMEANKLGLGDKTMPVRDPTTGASGMIRVSPDGTPTMGINSDGTMMDHKELTNFYAQAAQKKVAAAKAGAEYLGPNGEKGRLVTRNLPDGSTDTYIEHGGKRITGEAAQAWTPMSVENAAAKAEKQTTEQGRRAEKTTTETGIRKETGAQINQNYAGATGFNRAAGQTAGKLSVEQNTVIPFAQQRTGAVVNTPPVSGNAPSPVAPGDQATAPGINVAPPGAGPLPTNASLNPATGAMLSSSQLIAGKPHLGDPGINSPADLKAATKQWEENNKITQDAQKEVAKVAAKDITAKLNQAQALQAEVQNAHTWIDSGKTYFGGGANTIARTYYRHMPLVEQDEEMANTNRIMTLTKQENLQNLASMVKGSFSDKDMTYINQHTITENTNPKEVKKWLDHYNEVTIKAYNNQAAALKNPAAAGEALTVQNTAHTVRKYNPTTGRLE